MREENIFWNSLANEARGDASNLKGTDYHLVFALWLLLTEKASSVTFFAGNDLLAQPISPPPNDSAESLSTFIRAESATGETDSWLQLKCTQQPWTLSEVLGGTLVETFIINSLLSVSRGRGWQLQLITTSDIRTAEIERFIGCPSSSTQHSKKLDVLVQKTWERLQASASACPVPGKEILRARALEVLSSIAHSGVTHRAVLIAEIRATLATQFADAPTASRAFEQLYGAILADVSGLDRKPAIYDVGWLAQVAGCNFNTLGLLDASVTDACDAQVRDRAPQEYRADWMISRAPLINWFDDFLTSASTVFLLAGRSGTGKSWALTEWCMRRSGKIRLLIPAQSISATSSLAGIVGEALRPFTTQQYDNQALLRKLTAPVTIDTGPAVVVLDDIRPSSDHPDDYARMIARLVESARQIGLKLVISCQTDLARNLKPLAMVEHSCLFDPNSQKPLKQGSELDFRPGTVLRDYSDDEVRAALDRRVGSQSDALQLLLRDPALAPLRNPYALSVFLDSLPAPAKCDWDLLQHIGVSSLLSQRLDEILKKAGQAAGVDGAIEVLDAVIEVLWSSPRAQLSRMVLAKSVSERLGGGASKMLSRLYEVGLLDADKPEHFADRRIWSYCLARYAHAAGRSAAALNRDLRWENDHDIVEQLVANAEDPVRFASDLVQLDEKWGSAVADGLVYARPNDVRVPALLMTLARKEAGGWDAADSLGRFCLQSKRAWKWLVRRFISSSEDERRIAERAFWSLGPIAPAQLVESVKLRYRIVGRSPVSDRKDRNRRRILSRGLRALANVDSRFGAQAVRALLPNIRDLAELSLGRGIDNDMNVIRRDPLLDEYDQIRVRAALLAESVEFDEFLSDLSADELPRRARAINSLELIARSSPGRVRDALLDRLRHETVPDLLARVIWSSYRLLEQEPLAVVECLENSSDRLWLSYESAAATFALLELARPNDAGRVRGLLPKEWAAAKSEMHAVLAEIYCACWFRCMARSVTMPTIDWRNCPGAAWEASGANELYSLRARLVVTLLGAAPFEATADGPPVLRTELREDGPDFFQLDLSAWLSEQRNLVPYLERFETIADLVIRAVQSEATNQPHPLNRWDRNARFMLSRDCLDVLLHLLRSRYADAGLLEQLPTDWQRLYASACLLDAGLKASDLIDLAVRECETHRTTATGQASNDRAKCLVALQNVAPERLAPLASERHGIGWFLSGGTDAGTRLASAVDAASKDPIETLEAGVAAPSDIMLLRELQGAAMRWQTCLVGETYSRMFECRRLLPSDGRSLLEKMLCGLNELAVSAAQQEHIQLYDCILRCLDGCPVAVPSIRDEDNPIVSSHRLAASVLAQAEDASVSEVPTRLLMDRRGWHEDHCLRWGEFGEITRGSGQGYFLLIFFPAVRLAMLAIGERHGVIDPAFDWTKTRCEAQLAVKEIVIPKIRDANRRKGAIERLTTLAQKYPEQEFVHSELGLVLLEHSAPQQAQESLLRALALPLCDGEERGSVLYNLACCSARLGDADRCCELLLTSNDFSPLDKEWIRKDADLASVRDEPWFHDLLATR